jgi:hypothetical protein
VNTAVSAGKRNQKKTPAIIASTGYIDPPSINCIGYSVPRGPTSVSFATVKAKSDPVTIRNAASVA